MAAGFGMCCSLKFEAILIWLRALRLYRSIYRRRTPFTPSSGPAARLKALVCGKSVQNRNRHAATIKPYLRIQLFTTSALTSLKPATMRS